MYLFTSRPHISVLLNGPTAAIYHHLKKIDHGNSLKADDGVVESIVVEVVAVNSFYE